ncbi:PilZ domain-containing protein [Desulfobulbus alkaliphilus]|uniref:PilZ domain-containing protein n=1 Tax=Desulfobulbus alkaliphilus TaxID=869814 RepID=UPI0019664275|nr:PilZ domain-containing protein [Desulfobulbus alkaliphilus]MBM9536636.1 PilZ domain-containing protein [Desulfobulbus alkaliphilus]
MHGRSQTCTVKNGRIRVLCNRCGKKRYLTVPAGLRKKSVRCMCGMSAFYTLNHRAFPRESTCGKALVFLANGRQIPVYLCDSSLGGIGFNVPPQHSRSMATNQDLSIKFRSGSGATVQRKIRVKSMMNNRIGAQFLDGCLPTF